MALSQHDDRMNNVTGCESFINKSALLAETPLWDNFWWIDGHMLYPRMLRDSVQQVPDADVERSVPWGAQHVGGSTATVSDARRSPTEHMVKAAVMSHMSFMTYRKSQQIAVAAPFWGWTFVARACSAHEHQS